MGGGRTPSLLLREGQDTADLEGAVCEEGVRRTSRKFISDKSGITHLVIGKNQEGERL